MSVDYNILNDNDLMPFVVTCPTMYLSKITNKKDCDRPKRWQELTAEECKQHNYYCKKEFKVCGEQEYNLEEWQKGGHYKHEVFMVMTGKRTNLTVFDFDTNEVYDNFIKDYPEFKEAYTVKTPKGYHIYCEYNPEQHTTTGSNNPIDIRCDGANCFAVGTKGLNDKYYTLHINGKKDMPMPMEWYKKTFKNTPKLNYKVPTARPIAQNESVQAPEAQVGSNNTAKLIALQIGHKYIHNYGDWIKIVWAMRNCGIDKEFAINVSKKSVKYDDAGFNKVWENNKRDSVGLGTLKFYARLTNEYNYLNLMAQLDNYPECIRTPNDYNIAQQYIDLVADDIVVQGVDNDAFIYYEGRWVLDSSGCLIKQNINKIMTAWINIYITKIQKELDECDDDDIQRVIKDKMDYFIKQRHNYNTHACINKYYNSLITKLATPDERIQFDEQSHLFMFNNVCYDFNKKCFITPCKYDYMLKTAKYDWTDPTQEQMDAIDKLWCQIFPDEGVRKTYLSVLKQGMIGINAQKFVVANGSGGNGKGVLNELFLKTIGEYGCKGNINLITKPIPTGGCPELAQLHNMRFVLFQEPSENLKFIISVIKELTGGASCKARMLYSNKTDCLLKLIIVCELNVKPPFDGDINNALIRRLLDILFESVFTDIPSLLKDKTLTNIFKKDAYYTTEEFKTEHSCAMFKYIIDNAMDDIVPDERTVKRTKEYMEDSDTLLTWFKATYRPVKEDEEYTPIKIGELYDEFKKGECYTLLDKKQMRNNTQSQFKAKILAHNLLGRYYKDKITKNKVQLYNRLMGWVKKEWSDEDSEEEEVEC